MTSSPGPMPQEPTADLRTDIPHAARVYDVFLGGTTNYPADREQAAKVMRAIPSVAASARANRAFLHRAARHLVAEHGIRQFLDVGTGIPTPPTLHEVVQEIEPAARVLYADHDPIVMLHSRALRTGSPQGRTAYVEADAADPHALLAAPQLRDTLDLTQPVAVALCLLLHWMPPHCDPYDVAGAFIGALPLGSALIVTHLTLDFDPGVGQVEKDFEEKGSTVRARTRAEVTRFFDGLELIEPGVVVPQHWRPDPAPAGAGTPGDRDVPVWAGVGLKTR